MPVEADHVYLMPPKHEMIDPGWPASAHRARSEQGAVAAHRRLLALAGRGRGPARRRRGALGHRQRRLARHPRRSRGRRAGDGAGRIRQVRRHAPQRGRHRGGRPGAAAGGDGGGAVPIRRAAAATSATWRAGPTSDVLSRIFELLRKESGIDFADYKSSTVGRRIERRLLLTDTEDLEEYLDRIAGDPAELRSLYRDLLIGVTRFFRDEEAFERLRTRGASRAGGRSPRRRGDAAVGAGLRHRRGAVQPGHAGRGGVPGARTARRFSGCSPPTSTAPRWRRPAPASTRSRCSRSRAARHCASCTSGPTGTVFRSRPTCADTSCSPSTTSCETRRSPAWIC